MWWVYNLEYDLMEYCLKMKGKWWANHFFRNKEVNDMYAKLRKMDIADVYKIVNYSKSKG